MARPESQPRPDSQPGPDAQPGPDSQAPLDSLPIPSQPVLPQREFLKKLVGSAAGIAGLAAVGGLMTPATAEAAYTPGGASPGTPAGFGGFPSPATTGDYVNTNLLVEGHLEVKGYRPWIDVTAHGAVGDWSQWADAAVASAIAALPVTGGVIYFPPGIYAFQNPININVYKHLTIMGAGRAVTMLYWSPNATTGGLHITVGDPGYKVTVHDLLLYTDAASTTPALSFNASSWGGGPTATPHIHDIWITYGGAAGAHWAKGIEMSYAAGAKIERFEIVCGPGATHGIHFHLRSTIVNITSGAIMMPAGATGIEVEGELSEGMYIRGVEVIGGAIGYKLVSPSPGTAISDSHASTTDFGIYLVNHGEMAITGNLFYGGTAGPYTGIYCEGTGPAGENPSARRIRIVGNSFSAEGGTTKFGMYMKGTFYDNVIMGNVLSGMNWGIVFDPGATNGTNYNIIVGNRIQANPGQHLTTGVGTGNLYANNLLT